MTPESRADLLSWLRERPEDVRALARRFPPACKVRALVPLMVPGPGETGIVVSYGERGPSSPDGWMRVISPEGAFPDLGAQCMPEDLEVVGHNLYTSEDVADVLADLDRETRQSGPAQPPASEEPKP